MSSKGDVKEFFGMGVSEPDQSSVCFLWVPKVTWKSFLACVLRGVCSHPAGVRVFRNRTCWCSGVSEPDQSIVFYGFQRWRERVFWHAFCLACPASVRVFRNRTNSGVSEPYQSIVFYCFLWVPKVTWKSFLACVLLGFETISRVSDGDALASLFLWIPMDSKGNGVHFVGLLLVGVRRRR